MSLRTEDYVNQEELGHGQVGTVLLYRHRVTNELCAVKKIDLANHRNRKINLIERSREILQSLNCIFLVQYLGDFQSTSHEYCLCFEYMPGGDLQKLISTTTHIPREIIIRWVREVTSALCYLHSFHYIHRDVKPSNVLLTHTNPDFASAKLADFDTLREIHPDMTNYIGTKFYRAPEVNSNNYNEKVDIWSLGWLVLALFNPGKDFKQTDFSSLYIQDDAGRDFVSHCLTENPQNRPSAEELLHHPFLQSEELLRNFRESIVNSIVQTRHLATYYPTEAHSFACSALRQTLDTLDIYRDRGFVRGNEVQSEIEELSLLIRQLNSQLR